MTNNNLTEKQKRFCDEYLIDFNATRAYKVTYPNCQTDEAANAASSRLLRNVKVQEYLKDATEELHNDNKELRQKIINELSKIAFSDIRNLYTDTGRLKFMKDLDDNTAGAIASIETLEEYDGYGENREKIGDTQKVKLWDKSKALETLGRHLGMFKDKVEIETDKPFEVNINIRKK